MIDHFCVRVLYSSILLLVWELGDFISNFPRALTQNGISAENPNDCLLLYLLSPIGLYASLIIIGMIQTN